MTQTPPFAGAPVIVDNQSRKVGQVLEQRLVPDAPLSVVSAYFTIYAYGVLKGSLETAGPVRFLYGEPLSVGEVDPSESQAKAFQLTDDGGIALKEALRQKPLAKECADWIRRKVEVRTVAKTNFLHGKLYCINDTVDGTVIVGSSNFTRRGLGYGSTPNIELNVEVNDTTERIALREWFERLWNDEELTLDVKNEVVAALERLGKGYSPEFVYYKTLYHIFYERLTDSDKQDELFQGTHLHDTKIWKSLYQFQRDGATNAINRLLRYNGCIVADSVGLGKTWTALAVIKFFELRNERVLVLSPKRLEQNWKRYTSRTAQKNNPFDADRLGYTVLAHTDLSRYEGMSGDIDLGQFNWGAFDLIVIDESHNFRNQGRPRKENDDKHESRYGRLLNQVIKNGVNTKVLMLSATPVNTSLIDLRNQIYLMTKGDHEAFMIPLGIQNIQMTFQDAQRAFVRWENKRKHDGNVGKEELFENLGTHFLTLLDAVTIARSRMHIQKFYPEVDKLIGGFPQREPPKNLNPPTDNQGKLSYDALHEQIGEINLAIYVPSEYLIDKSDLEAERSQSGYNQYDRERLLIGMMRINLLKRLESSVKSFKLTVERILGKIEDLNRRITAWEANKQNDRLDIEIDEDDEDDEFVIGKKRQYRFSELDVNRWRQDLLADERVLSKLHSDAAEISPQRDGKLSELRNVLREKINSPSRDKDNVPNRKALIFTTFADTARYLYDQLERWLKVNLDAESALVTGGDAVKTTLGTQSYDEILARFSPKGQQREVKKEIDVLIATDCISEGQNLQDCDLVINYDIHWNPVRIMQRFGRIDRLGSRNHRVCMTNFWPTANLDRYLDLRNRVQARMALVDATATGSDDPFDGSDASGDTNKSAQLELQFRNEQLRRLRAERLDFGDNEDDVAMSDFTLDDFLADLMTYLQKHRKALEAAPLGICAIVEDHLPRSADPATHPGAIFCLKQRNSPKERTPNRLQPYYLMYVRADGSVRFTFHQTKHVLTSFQSLTIGKTTPMVEIEDQFDQETEHGTKMHIYEGMLGSALRSLVADFGRMQQRALARQRDAVLSKWSEAPKGDENFELITWLVIKDAR